MREELKPRIVGAYSFNALNTPPLCGRNILYMWNVDGVGRVCHRVDLRPALLTLLLSASGIIRNQMQRNPEHIRNSV